MGVEGKGRVGETEKAKEGGETPDERGTERERGRQGESMTRECNSNDCEIVFTYLRPS